MIFNSVISDARRGARFCTTDIKDFFLQSNLPEPEYMKIHGKYFFEDIRENYNINNIEAEDGYVYYKIKKGCYGLKQAATLAREQPVKHLEQYGYLPDPYAQNIWGHVTRPTKFCLCVANFGIKLFSDEDTEHLLGALKERYKKMIDK